MTSLLRRCSYNGGIKFFTPTQDHPHDPRQLVRKGNDSGILCTRCISARSQPPSGVALVKSVGSADLAPWISSFRKYLLPRFVMPTKRGFPPVVIWRGTSPSQAARSRPRANASPLPIAATSAVAFSTPMPGMVASLRALALARACVANSLSKAAIR
jgi:hypothetical protein